MAYHGEDYNRLINCAKWRHIRDDYLGTHHLCENCLKNRIYTPSQCVHHIVPIEDARDKIEMASLAYNPNNLMALCIDCHVSIHKEMGQKTKEKLLERKIQRANRAIDQLFGPKE